MHKHMSVVHGICSINIDWNSRQFDKNFIFTAKTGNEINVNILKA